ncbi:MAG: methylmalonyl-CoA mutase family protein [Bacillota bacterium]|nr:methylmalonyl-CoA mutase family protein [Bacillota bacterium]MDW7684796.1 methylmalonyl-CoA mutase family protein [Bacillota bacterium]
MSEKQLFSRSALRRLYEQKAAFSAGKETSDSFTSRSGIEIQPCYSPDNIPDFDYNQLGFPGSPPYTRGIFPLMYQNQPWTFRQLAGYGSAEDTNARYRFLIANGATGINGVFDYPTLRGYDSDNPVAEGDLGQGGVAIDSIEDMHLLFKDIPIDEVSVSLVVCNPVMAVPVFAMYLAMAEERGILWNSLRGTNQNDFLMETAITTAPVILQPHFSFRLSTDIVEFCTGHVPRWHPISYTGYNYRESGVNAIQEVGMVMANAIATIEEMLKRGYNIDDFAPRLSVFFSADSDFFEEVAKYRAARRVWFNLLTEEYGANKKNSRTLRFHVQTSGASLTPQQPLNNVTRSAFQALSAVLGGAQSIHVNGYDEALAIPTEEAAIVALRTQQIILHETNAAYTADPLGGSYYIETLTNELEQKINEFVSEVTAVGGMVAAVESGMIHDVVSKAANEHFKKVRSGEQKVVGLNCFKHDTEPEIEIFRAPDILEKQKQKLSALRQGRDEEMVKAGLAKVKEACLQERNVMPAVLEAVKNRATLEEVCNVFRNYKGGWKLPI